MYTGHRVKDALFQKPVQVGGVRSLTNTLTLRDRQSAHHHGPPGALALPGHPVQDNLTAILYKTEDIRLEQQEVPEPASDQVTLTARRMESYVWTRVRKPGCQVLLRMDSVGICGSDVHYWTHGEIGDFIVK